MNASAGASHWRIAGLAGEGERGFDQGSVAYPPVQVFGTTSRSYDSVDIELLHTDAKAPLGLARRYQRTGYDAAYWPPSYG